MGQSRLGYIIPIIIFIIFKTCNSYIKLYVLKNLSQVVDSTKEVFTAERIQQVFPWETITNDEQEH